MASCSPIIYLFPFLYSNKTLAEHISQTSLKLAVAMWQGSDKWNVNRNDIYNF